MATGKEVYQQLIVDATAAFEYAERVLRLAETGRRVDGTYTAKTERRQAVSKAKKELAKAEKNLLAAYKKAERHDAKQKAKAEQAAERQRVKTERASQAQERQQEYSPAPQPETAPATSVDRSDIIETIRQRRKRLGADTTLEEQVLGTGGGGIRDVAQDFISANRELFDPNKMSGLAAQELLEQAVNLSEDALEARDAKEASYYLVRLKSILNIAKQAKGGTAEAVSSQIESLIQPVVETLKKQSGFGARVKEGVETYARSIPERLLSGIPVIGGLLSDIARERREARDTESEFLGRIGKRVSRRGAKTRAGYLEFGGASTGRAMSAIASRSSGIPFPTSPASKAADVGELSSPEYGAQAQSPLEGLNTVADAIGDKGSKDPRTLIGLMALIAKKLGVDGGGLSSLLGQTGGGSGDGESSGGLLDTAIDVGSMALGKKAAPKMTGMLSRTASKVATKGGGLLSSIGTGLSSTASKVATKGGGLLSSIGTGLSSAYNAVGGAVSGVASKLNPMNLLSESVKGSAKSVGKALLSAPGVGALLETAIGAMDIASTKSDPNMSPDEKKEMIGKQLVGTIGGALGSIGGGVLAGALGSVIPGAGTAIGGIVGSMGGAWLGRWLGEQLGESLGGRGIYDMVESIPGLGSLISVDGGAQPQAETGAGATGYQGSVAPTSGTGSEVGRQAMAAGAARSELASAAASTPAANSSVVATNNSRTSVNNVTNNFNDDLRIRNNEPTIKAFQMGSIMPA